jgi:hypothetical protein
MDMNYAYLLDGVTIASQLSDEAADGDGDDVDDDINYNCRYYVVEER